jgi:hypothetical protein
MPCAVPPRMWPARIHHRSRVVDRDVVEDRHLARLRVDLGERLVSHENVVNFPYEFPTVCFGRAMKQHAKSLNRLVGVQA